MVDCIVALCGVLLFLFCRMACNKCPPAVLVLRKGMSCAANQSKAKKFVVAQTPCSSSAGHALLCAIWQTAAALRTWQSSQGWSHECCSHKGFLPPTTAMVGSSSILCCARDLMHHLFDMSSNVLGVVNVIDLLVTHSLCSFWDVAPKVTCRVATNRNDQTLRKGNQKIQAPHDTWNLIHH